MEIPDDVVASVVPLKDDGELTLTDFVIKARTAIDDMLESYFDCTGEDPEVPQTLDFWLEQFGTSLHNS